MKTTSDLAARVFNSESDPSGSRLFSVVAAAGPEFVAVTPVRVASDANSEVVALGATSLVLITARATSTPAAASTITPITQRLLPGLLGAWQPQPASQSPALGFSRFRISPGVPLSLGVFIIALSLFSIC